MAAYDPYDEEGDYYYTLPSSDGDRFAAGSGSAVAFDEPTANGIRFPIATPQAGSFDLGAVPPDLIRTPEQSAAAYASRDQYNAELARAERNRFDEQMQQDPQAVQQAVRMKGLLKYQQLVRDGANPAEAIRLAAPELYFNHPQATVQATRMATPVLTPSISTVAVPGGTAVLNNGRLHSVLKTPVVKPAPVAKDVPPPELKAEQSNNSTRIQEAQKEYNRQAAALLKASTPEEKSSIGRAALAARDELDRLMSNRVVLSTNYPRPSIQAPPSVVQQALTPPPAEDDMVPVIGPDGVRGRVPRSKLDAAIKQGYKER